MHQLITPDGTYLGDVDVDVDLLRDLYSAMFIGRVYDRKASAMQRQGRLATYAPFEGQEAAQVGAARALRSGDWLVATYRDALAMSLQGYPWVNLILGRTGDERGGRAPDGANVLPPSITVGGHMIHAVGLSWAAKIRGHDDVAMTLFGDGATSEGDFHEAMNFAGVFATPTIFVCQNNGWAISLPFEQQTASATIAQKADAYGMPGVRVDGNDVLAVYHACKEAVDRARSGDGPTLIEAVTFRLGPHTTADDPSRYRSDATAEEWRMRDPLTRAQRLLERLDAWDPAWHGDLEATAAAEIEAAVAEAESLAPLTVAEVADGMFASRTAALDEQVAEREASR